MLFMLAMSTSHAASVCAVAPEDKSNACYCIKRALVSDETDWNDQLTVVSPRVRSAAIGSCFDFGTSAAGISPSTQKLLLGAGTSLLNSGWDWMYSSVVGDSTVMLNMQETGTTWGWYPVPMPNVWELLNEHNEVGATLESNVPPTGAFFSDLDDDGLLELVVGFDDGAVEVFEGGFDPQQPLIPTFMP